MRATAILLVLALHASQVSNGIPASLAYASAFGWMGVDIFFVLSGFLIGRQLFEASSVPPLLRIKEFYIKRWVRTLPLYFTVLCFYVVAKPLLGFPFQGEPLAYIVFLQNYLGIEDFVQSWSLCIEEQFYLFFPLIALLVARARLPAFAWLLPAMLSLVFRFFWSQRAGSEINFTIVSQEVMFRTHLHLDGLSVGVFLASTHGSWCGWTQGRKQALALLGSALLAVTLFFSGPGLIGNSAIYCFTGLALGTGLILPWCLTLSASPRLNSVVQKIALLSFGVYIWNDVVGRFVHKLPISEGAWPLRYGLFILLSFAVAFVSYRLVELKALKLRAKLLRSIRER